jgi:prolyl-tRNA synthetase
LVPDESSVLADPLVIRPTSETIIWSTFSRWIQSYKDLPLKVNQWANVMRWEEVGWGEEGWDVMWWL